MPGPCNSRKKKKIQLKKQEKKSRSARESLEPHTPQSPPTPPGKSPSPPARDPALPFDLPPPLSTSTSQSTSASFSPDALALLEALPTPETGVYIHDSSPQEQFNSQYRQVEVTEQTEYESEGLPLPKIPFIQDPGNGPRVRDTRTFLASSFAAPPSLEDPLCAEFAQEELLQMLCSVLPEETALILWYNKSRLKARICPACQRLYRLGDVLRDHHDNFNIKVDGSEEGDEPRRDEKASESRYKEQKISGLCSPVCFILASYNYPLAIRSTWGRMAEDLTDETWDLLSSSATRTNDMGLGLLLKMTRCHDLGLGQLVFPGLDLGEEGEEEDHPEFYEYGSDYDSEDSSEERPLRFEIIETGDSAALAHEHSPTTA